MVWGGHNHGCGALRVATKTKIQLYHKIFPTNLIVASRMQSNQVKTYPADCRKIAAVDSNKHDWGLKE